jgi:hypothetical protein
MHRYWGFGGLLLLGIFTGLWAAIPRAAEPVYAGKTVSAWLDAGFEDTSMGLHEIGPPAVPFIMAKLAREDPQYGSSRRYRGLWKKTLPTLRWILPKPITSNFDELRACSSLLAIGPRIIPLLADRLESANPIVRDVSAHVLGTFYAEGRDIQRAMPGLVKAARDPNTDVRTRAAWALGEDSTFLARH